MEARHIEKNNTKRQNNTKKHIDKKTKDYYTIFERADIAKFTYQDYLKCIEYEEELERRKGNKYVEEEKEKYEIIEKIELDGKINKEHDKTYWC